MESNHRKGTPGGFANESGTNKFVERIMMDAIELVTRPIVFVSFRKFFSDDRHVVDITNQDTQPSAL